MAVATAAAPKTGAATPPATKQPQQVLPFPIGSRNASRFSFNLPTTELGTSSIPLSPVQIPAVGYLNRISLDVTVTITGGTTPAVTADGPFNILSSIELRNSSGNDLIVPMDGYRYFLLNKYGAQTFDAPFCDPMMDGTYDEDPTGGTVHFILDVPCQIAPAEAFCAIPALASNRSYQLSINLNTLANSITGSPTSVSVAINGFAWYWTEPVAMTMTGLAQQTAPAYNGSLNLWQYQALPVTSGDKYLKSDNVGNVLRTLIFTLRNSSGARIDTDWPAVCELYLDNSPMFHLPQDLWKSWMTKVYALAGGTLDGKNGLDTGVYVIPFLALAEGKALANGRRSQYLPTLDASLLQLRGTSWGSNASTLEIITNSVQPVNPMTGNSAAALYSIS